jgi:hypothetical protein
VVEGSRTAGYPGTVVLIRTEIDSVIGPSIPVRIQLVLVAIARNGKHAYLSNFSQAGNGTVIAIQE